MKSIKNIVLKEGKKMALINCSECKREISDKATSCPYCGCPTNQMNGVVSESHNINLNTEGVNVTVVKKKEKKNTRNYKKSLLVLIALMLVLAIGYLIVNQIKEQQKEREYQEYKEQWVEISEKAIQEFDNTMNEAFIAMDGINGEFENCYKSPKYYVYDVEFERFDDDCNIDTNSKQAFINYRNSDEGKEVIDKMDTYSAEAERYYDKLSKIPEGYTDINQSYDYLSNAWFTVSSANDFVKSSKNGLYPEDMQDSISQFKQEWKKNKKMAESAIEEMKNL